ncbi:MAG: nucleotidyltransferase domain-containing protein [Candidatus Altiarchaeota archaeon]|nr:nucleotidyltransferase domain-containing protein [Candidatus Altiarchaeota archaeon]
MKAIIFEDMCFKILTVFSLAPGKSFTREGLKKKTKANNVPLDKALTKLLCSKILIKNYRKYELNHSGEWMTKLIEMIEHEHWKLKKIPLDVYFAVTDLSRKLLNYECDAYLFGSYSKLTFTVDSDIDVAVITRQKIDRGFLKKMELRYGVEIQLHIFSPDVYQKKKDPFVKGVLEGVKLIETLKK